jgi:hypothetical protein
MRESRRRVISVSGKVLIPIIVAMAVVIITVMWAPAVTPMVMFFLLELALILLVMPTLILVSSLVIPPVSPILTKRPASK